MKVGRSESETVIPETMKAARVCGYSDDVTKVLTIEEGVKVPSLEDTPPAEFKDSMLIKVLSVALAPGDVRVMSGKTRVLQGPPGGPPYTPGGDVCGIVVQVPEGDKCRFQVGQRVAARFLNKPMGVLGEYALVSMSVCDVVTDDALSSAAAAALVSSATVAVILADRIKKDDRVLIFGAGGGVGSHLCQLARLRGASFVAGVARDTQRLLEKPLCCDQAVDYTTTDPFSIQLFKDNPFDVIVDLSCGNYPKIVASNSKNGIIKSASRGGRYYTTNPDRPVFELNSWWGAIEVFLFPALWRAIYSRSVHRYSLPSFSYVFALPDAPDVVTRTLDLANEGKLQASIDSQGPFPFTTEGLRDAFKLQVSTNCSRCFCFAVVSVTTLLVQASYHAKGKVVISVSEE